MSNNNRFWMSKKVPSLKERAFLLFPCRLKNEGPLLHTLTLGLSSNLIGDRGAQALAVLKETPLLHTLTLDLGANSVGASGGQALAALKEAPWLRTLTLYLHLDSVGTGGAQALAALKEAPLLHTLTLDLSSNLVGASGALILTIIRWKTVASVRNPNPNLATTPWLKTGAPSSE